MNVVMFAWQGAEEDAEDDAPPGVPGWQEAYYTLVLLQKVRGWGVRVTIASH